MKRRKKETKVVDLVSFSGQVDKHGVPLFFPLISLAVNRSA